MQIEEVEGESIRSRVLSVVAGRTAKWLRTRRVCDAADPTGQLLIKQMLLLLLRLLLLLEPTGDTLDSPTSLGSAGVGLVGSAGSASARRASSALSVASSGASRLFAAGRPQPPRDEHKTLDFSLLSLLADLALHAKRAAAAAHRTCTSLLFDFPQLHFRLFLHHR